MAGKLYNKGLTKMAEGLLEDMELRPQNLQEIIDQIGVSQASSKIDQIREIKRRYPDGKPYGQDADYMKVLFLEAKRDSFAEKAEAFRKTVSPLESKDSAIQAVMDELTRQINEGVRNYQNYAKTASSSNEVDKA